MYTVRLKMYTVRLKMYTVRLKMYTVRLKWSIFDISLCLTNKLQSYNLIVCTNVRNVRNFDMFEHFEVRIFGCSNIFEYFEHITITITGGIYTRLMKANVHLKKWRLSRIRAAHQKTHI